ncbi:hypothetical protein LOZ65_002689 [Ophidiomyces ophidiicola]|nr:hypothetical protein LOZ65_002689 [Ophidiomyces ophidiicola]
MQPSLIDTRNLLDLEDLVDGMDLSEDWGRENLNLDGNKDSDWAQNYIEVLKDNGVENMWILIDANPSPRRELWKKCVQSKQRRMGWKYSPEIYATRFRKFGSKDPRLRNRPGL